MKFELDHIGIAVDEINPIQELFQELFGISFAETEKVEQQKVEVVFSEKLNDPSIELLRATSDRSPAMPMLSHPIKSYIHKNGNGIHHLCFKVDNIEQATKFLKEKGVDTVPNASIGRKGHKVTFLNPNQTCGILIELSQST